MKIKIISNPRKDWAKATALEAKAMLRQHKYEIVRSGANTTICIGGDGTILYASHKKRLEGIVLGIGSKSSYICQLRDYNWKEKLIPLLEKRRTVTIHALEADIGERTYTAINDFVIHTSNYRVLVLATSIQGETKTFESDGLIVSSAIGSAAYAYSAGGERLAPTERALCVVPICPYKRAFKACIVGEDEEIGVVTGSNCAFISDGILVKYLKKGTSIRIKRGRDIQFYEGVGSDG